MSDPTRLHPGAMPPKREESATTSIVFRAHHCFTSFLGPVPLLAHSLSPSHDPVMSMERTSRTQMLTPGKESPDADKPRTKFRAVYRFNEGSSSAVRTNVKMSALM